MIGSIVVDSSETSAGAEVLPLLWKLMKAAGKKKPRTKAMTAMKRTSITSKAMSMGLVGFSSSSWRSTWIDELSDMLELILEFNRTLVIISNYSKIQCPL